jgi:hypothetical protein
VEKETTFMSIVYEGIVILEDLESKIPGTAFKPYRLFALL